jgi:hypothetical protein
VHSSPLLSFSYSIFAHSFDTGGDAERDNQPLLWTGTH